MRRRLILSHVLIVVVVLAALEIPLGVLFARRQQADLAELATRQAALIATFVGPDFDQPVGRSLDVVLNDLGSSAPAEITVVDREGNVVAARRGSMPDDVDAAPQAAVSGALAGRVVTGTIDDDGQRWTYSAVPVTSRDSGVGAVLVSVPAHDAEERIATTWILLVALAGGVITITALVAAGVTRWLTRPVTTLAAAVERLSAGDLQAVAPTGTGPPELRALARQVNDMARRLDALLQTQRRFLADASHQLRAPLTALRLRIENLDATADPATLDAEVESALAESDRLARLLDGLLALSRADSAASVPAPVDLRIVVRERVDAWSPLCAEHGVELRAIGEVNVESGPAVVASAGEGHLEQVLDNLIANSLEASSSGSTIDLSITRSIGDGRVAVTVVDHGTGMTDEQRAHAFDRFWQSDTRGSGGTGLGLSIVRQLTLADGGDVVLEPTPGGGLTATVALRPWSG